MAENVAHIARERVIERLAQATAYRVAVVVAGAGYGKTTAVRALAARLPASVYHAVPHLAGSLDAFLRALARALAEPLPAFAATVDRALVGAHDADDPVEALVAWASPHLQAIEGTLVIDDLHHTDIESPGLVARFLARLVETLTDGPRWLFVTRVAGALPTATWALYGVADDPVGPADLAMHAADAAELAAASGSMLTPADLAHLVAFTRGWPFLLAYAIRTSRRVAELDRIEQITREMTFRYLAEQLWSELADDEQRLLFFAALLNGVAFDDTLPGVRNVRRTLQRLARTMPFVNVTAHAFTLHDLVRDFARTHFLTLDADVRCDLLTQAARVFEGRGALGDALSALIETSDASRVYAFAERHFTTLIEDAYITECQAILTAFPCADPSRAPDVHLALAIRLALVRQGLHTVATEMNVLLDRPAAWMYRIIALRAFSIDALNTGTGAAALPRLDAALLDDPPPLARALVLACRATLLAHEGKTTAARGDLFAAVALVGSIESVEHALVVNTIAIAYHACGDFEAAIRESRRAAAFSEAHACWHLASGIRINEMVIALRDARYDAFVRASEGAIAASRAAGNWAALRTARQLIAFVHAISNRPDDALAAMTADPASTLVRMPNVVAGEELCTAIVAMSRGEFERAHVMLGRRSDWASYGYLAVQARLLAAAMLGRDTTRELAAARSQRNLDTASAPHGGFPRYLAIATHLARRRWHAGAAALGALDRPPEAFADLHEAMRSLGEGPPFTGVRPALERAAATPFAGFIAGVLLRTIDSDLEARHAPSTIVLTAAESAVLLLIDEGRSYQEIATYRGSSLSTVKAQASSVFRKLGTPGNRVRALNEAHRRGLLP
jgi:ATP/maltotriose-dependent transcriptional regulator MalT